MFYFLLNLEHSSFLFQQWLFLCCITSSLFFLPNLMHLVTMLSFLPSSGVAASSFFTSGKYAIDPELRGAEFERITQNLDVHFWKTFWNITETEVLSVNWLLKLVCTHRQDVCNLTMLWPQTNAHRQSVHLNDFRENQFIALVWIKPDF